MNTFITSCRQHLNSNIMDKMQSPSQALKVNCLGAGAGYLTGHIYGYFVNLPIIKTGVAYSIAAIAEMALLGLAGVLVKGKKKRIITVVFISILTTAIQILAFRQMGLMGNKMTCFQVATCVPVIAQAFYQLSKKSQNILPLPSQNNVTTITG